MRRGVVALVVLGLGAAAAGGGWALGRSSDESNGPPTSTAPGSTAPPAAAPPPPTTTAAPAPRIPGALDLAGWQRVAGSLSPVTLPSDCPLPLDEPASLPGSDRSYRGGVHQGIDFICLERGRTAVSALPGRVVLANDSYVDPPPGDRSAILAEAQALGRTPPWTLALLFGRFVVVDHGVIAGAGHVVTISAHLERVDPAIRPGLAVDAGTPLGEIGNRGTEAAGTGADNPRSIHLHWELHVDDTYLGAGLGTEDVRALYAALFDG